MAKKPARLEQLGVTPAKLGVMVGLGVVLLVVLYLQFGASGEEASPDLGALAILPRPETNAIESEQTSEAATRPKTPEDRTAVDRIHWQPPDLAAVTKYDPFALPASFPQPPSLEGDGTLVNLEKWSGDPLGGQIDLREQQMTQWRSDLESLRNQGVQVVLSRDEQYVAQIGDRTLQVGDEINGFKVIAIDAAGVRVARDLKP